MLRIGEAGGFPSFQRPGQGGNFTHPTNAAQTRDPFGQPGIGQQQADDAAVDAAQAFYVLTVRVQHGLELRTDVRRRFQ